MTSEERSGGKELRLEIKYVTAHQLKYCVINNFEAVAKRMHKPVDVVARYFVAKLEPRAYRITKQGSLVISGRPGHTFLTDILAEFSRKYVVCPKCHSMDTHLSKQGDNDLDLTCNRCYHQKQVNHRRKTAVIAGLVDNIDDRKETPSAPAKPSSEEDTREEEPPLALQTTAPPHDSEHEKFSLQDAYKKVREHANDVEIGLEVAQDCVADLDLSSVNVIPLIWFGLVRNASHYRTAIGKYGALLRAAIDSLVPYDGSLLVLGCVEQSLFADDPMLQRAAIKVVPRILKALYEHGVLDADTIIGWLDGTVKAVGSDLLGETIVPTETKCAVLKRSKRLIALLREENPHVLPRVATVKEEGVEADFLKLDLVKVTKPRESITRQQTDRSTGWQDVIEEDTIGDDWTFLEDALM